MDEWNSHSDDVLHDNVLLKVRPVERVLSSCLLLSVTDFDIELYSLFQNYLKNNSHSINMYSIFNIIYT